MLKLVDLNQNNWKDASKLEVHDSQKNFIASNLHSIAESCFYDGTLLKGIYNDSEMIGFSLCFFPSDEQEYGYIVRYMIDKKHQKKGYGTKGLHLLLKEVFKQAYAKKYVTLTVIPENDIAKRLYERVGFHNTNEIVEGELKYLYTF